MGEDLASAHLAFAKVLWYSAANLRESGAHHFAETSLLKGLVDGQGRELFLDVYLT